MRHGACLLFAVGCLSLAGCGAEASQGGAASGWTVIGGAGRGDGALHEPRGIEAFPDASCLVVDRTGRVQRFDATGALADVWWLSDYRAGQPIDLTATPWGTVLVADTHYQRVLEFDARGQELRQLGSGAQLALVRGVAVGADEVIYVADYGQQDRVHRYDRAGHHLGSFGSTGTGPGQFMRPEGLAVGANGEVYVVDCGNHRVQRFTPDGRLLGSFGAEGEGPGDFLFPFDIAIGSGGAVFVVDYRGNRVQRFTATGEWLDAAGGPGRAPGHFATPRGVAVLPDPAGDLVFVADTYNHRVQRARWKPMR